MRAGLRVRPSGHSSPSVSRSLEALADRHAAPELAHGSAALMSVSTAIVAINAQLLRRVRL